MVKLNEYLGALVSNLSQARVLADLESARIAGTYASDVLLKHFSIPRMKIEEVEITIPVAIDEVTNSEPKTVNPIDNKKFESVTYQEVLSLLEIKSMPMELSKPFRREIFNEVKIIESKINQVSHTELLNNYLQSISELTSFNIDNLIKLKKLDLKKREDKTNIIEKLRKNLQGKLIPEFKPDRSKSGLLNLNITAESDKLREKKPDSLVIIKMKISEEGMEWERMDDGNGNIISKLMPS